MTDQLNIQYQQHEEWKRAAVFVYLDYLEGIEEMTEDNLAYYLMEEFDIGRPAALKLIHAWLKEGPE